MSNFNTRRGEVNRPRNLSLTLPLFGGDTDKNGRKFDRSTLLDILAEFDFSKISIPVYTYKGLAFGENKKGTFIVGYIRQFNIEDESLHVIIYNYNAEIIKSFEDIVVYPRMIIDEKTGEVKTILALDIAPKQFFE